MDFFKIELIEIFRGSGIKKSKSNKEVKDRNL